MLGHMLLERWSRQSLPRVPEPEMVMEDPAQIEAFLACGREDGLLAPIYLYHALQCAPVIGPGDTVLDLACGPANQLVQMARLQPQAHFIGMDISSGMLTQAQATLQRCGVENVELRAGDMTRLDDVADAGVDAVVGTLCLHHLADTCALHQTLRAVRRVLKPGGGLYLADFGRLKRERTQHFFAHDRAELQSPQFTADFLHSLRAAFSVEELGQALGAFGDEVRLHRTALAPFMVIVRNTRARCRALDCQPRARALFASLTADQRRYFRALAGWFRAGGLALPFNP